MTRPPGLVAALALAGALALVGAPRAARAQQTQTEIKLRAQRDTLDQIRRERAELEARMRTLQSSAHSLSDEVTNLDERASATARLVNALDRQLVEINADVSDATGNMVRAEDDLTAQRAVLDHRLMEIYKRGPMFTFQVLLSAQSFGDLVARYKYLHLLTLRDRALVKHVQDLRDQVQLERNRLVTLQNAVVQNRSDKAREEGELRALERQRQHSLSTVNQQVQQTQARLAAVRRTESQLTGAIASLEAARKRAEAASPSTAVSRSTIRTSDYGKLDWPVQGDILYPFGRQVQSNNTTIRWNGIGIAAPLGTPVHVVAAGEVVSVSQLGLYGLTVIVDHGGGDYSIYGSLQESRVKRGDHVIKDQVIGSVGMSDPDFPAHLHFEVREHGGPAVDPTTWLRHR
ncbi:MAG TPA: peptidoglycan DD-metalloendopeptidase family protein [Gemmatimonadaceae bacterium]|nr:peptidoglycan DD-metalloendopeptidase family protein [Gemmatimonadaceae bacterium]